MTRLPQNLRSGIRQLVHYPSHSVTAIVCLTLGTSINLAIFSLLYSLLVDPLPGVQSSYRLVTVTSKPISIPGLEGQSFTRSISYPDFLDYHEKNEVFSGFAALYPAPLHMSDDLRAERVRCQFVTGEFFDLLDLTPALGRLINKSDLEGSLQVPSAVISHDLWLRRFAGDSGLVGQMITLNRSRVQVLGVAPAEFRGVFLGEDTDIWLPLTQVERLVAGFPTAGLRDPANGWLLWFVARLRDGMTLGQAQAHLDLLSRQLSDTHGEDRRDVELEVSPGIGIRPGMRHDALEPLWLLSAAVTLVLFIACANVAGLMLVRGLSRREELRVRLALGASQRHVFLQLFAEGAVLVTISTTIGLGLSLLLLRALAGARLGQYLPPLPKTGLDPQLLILALVCAFVATLLTGTLPAIRASRSLRPTLRHVLGDTRRGRRLRQGLVVIQVALAFVLLSGTGLFLRTLWNLQAVDPGFRGDRVLSMRLDLRAEGYGEAEGRSFAERLLTSLDQLPTLSSVTLATQAPLGHGEARGSLARVRVAGAGDDEHWLQFNRVGPSYFRTLSIPVLQGREFTSEDRQGTPPVVVVNQALSRRLWPEDKDVVNKTLQMDGQDFRVVGVAGNIHYSRLDEEGEPYFFLPLLQSFSPELFLQVRAEGDPWEQAASLRNTILGLDKRIAVFDVELLSRRVDSALAQPRLYVRLLGAFGALALTLTVVGIYGAMAYSGVERQSEIGVRIALGADRSRILLSEIAKALRLSALGLGLGLVIAVILGRFLEGRLYGVEPLDAWTLTVTSLGVFGVTALASYLPARRATRIEPSRALQS